ncbi:MAG: aldolase/citrate lyase family protein [Alphaproteobacteria bacterium]
MSGVVNQARARLEAGELALGCGLRQTRTVDIGRIMAACGYDFLFIDMEHGSHNLDQVAQIQVAALDAGIAPIVRVPGFEHHHASRALDAGAMGIVFPHVDTPEQAATLADYCRFPPAGKRSMGGPAVQLGFGGTSPADAVRLVNELVLVTVMVETRQAIENVDAIAATPGVDVVLVGSNDLCLDMGIPGQHEAPELIEAYEKIIAGCKRHGKWAGLGGVYVPELMEKRIAMGFRMILSGNDLGFMMNGAHTQASFLRDLKLG